MCANVIWMPLCVHPIASLLTILLSWWLSTTDGIASLRIFRDTTASHARVLQCADFAGPKFGELQDHVLVIQKALSGLHSSGKMWHEKFADCMRHLGFFPLKSEPDVWVRRNGDICKHVAVCVNDLAFAIKDPDEFLKALSSDPFNFTIFKFASQSAEIVPLVETANCRGGTACSSLPLSSSQ